jgi:hypothetical protein
MRRNGGVEFLDLDEADVEVRPPLTEDEGQRFSRAGPLVGDEDARPGGEFDRDGSLRQWSPGTGRASNSVAGRVCATSTGPFPL